MPNRALQIGRAAALSSGALRLPVMETPSLIVYSYDIFAAQAAGGVSRSMVELMQALPHDAVDWRLWAGRHSNDLLAAALLDTDFARHVEAPQYIPNASRLGGVINNEPKFARTIGRSGAKLVHRTYYPFLDLVARRGVVRVETLHDMWDERAGGGRANQLKSLIKRRALERADAIVCVSHSTRNELADVWPSLQGRTVVIPHGVQRLSHGPRSAPPARPYFLFVGRRGTYKNFMVAVEAMRLAALPDHEIVCFGGGEFDASERAAIAAAGLASRVFRRGGGDDVLAGWYEGATALLYPSRYEGFGLPLLEAMVHGCPVIAAPLTSLPEVGGDAAIYADPSRPEDWAAAMTALAGETDVGASLRERGYARAATFSWVETAERHVALYRDLAG